MLTISYTYRMFQRHDRSLRAKTERLFLLGIEQCRICQNRETINLWRRYCLEVNESITILSGADVLALPHEHIRGLLNVAHALARFSINEWKKDPNVVQLIERQLSRTNL